jgi:putative methionine-R-sulfoxide reductase with GAF domain/uncharacterized Zn finger protein (UPF0148 family)
MSGSAHPEDPLAKDQLAGTANAGAGSSEKLSSGPASDSALDNAAFSNTELDSALQLLVERAQYITGATGAALALPQGEEMVCRASAGSCAPAIGARLQVRSGLTGESIARRQLLRCDNAESDTRVNLEACRALGIASIVVLPLLRRNGQVRGLFELFSDHPYAFEERDLIALERMADLTLTALDLAEQRENIVPPQRTVEKAVDALRSTSAPTSAPASPASSPDPALGRTVNPPPEAVISHSAASESVQLEARVVSALSAAASAPAPIHGAMHLAQKCSSCGFPVSEGRTLCLDCEKKQNESHQQTEEQQPGPSEMSIPEEIRPAELENEAPDAAGQEEFVPAFLVNSKPASESWLSNPVNVLAFVVLILCILVAVVVFR